MSSPRSPLPPPVVPATSVPMRSRTSSTVRDRLRRRPLGLGLWAGLVLLAVYVGFAVSAVVVFWGSLGAVPINPDWIGVPPFGTVTPPSYSHPFGVLPGIGTGLFRAVWQATPWDLALVASILAFDALLGWMLGALAGMHEGGPLDAVITFVGDTFGAIPSFFLVVALFAGLSTVDPSSIGLPAFVLLFGIVIWPTTARTTRERARLVAREPFLESAKASGAESSYLYFRHILPNSLSPLLAQIPLDFAPIFFVLSVFPWFWDCASLGAASRLHVPQPYIVPSIPPFSPVPALNFPEWGNLLAVGVCEGLPISGVGPTYLWMFVPTLAVILGLGIALALVCDGIDKRMSLRFR